MPLTPPSRQLDASKGEKPIRLYVVANTCYVWDAAGEPKEGEVLQDV